MRVTRTYNGNGQLIDYTIVRNEMTARGSRMYYKALIKDTLICLLIVAVCATILTVTAIIRL